MKRVLTVISCYREKAKTTDVHQRSEVVKRVNSAESCLLYARVRD